MRLNTGESAPSFSARNWDGDPVSLDDYSGKVWLAFFRYASCPFCNLRMREIITRHDEFGAAGLDVVSVFQSPGEKIREYVFETPPPFPMISDPDEALYAQYRLERSATGFFQPRNATRFVKAVAKGLGGMSPDGSMDRIPADFLIRDGVIEHAYYGTAISDHIPMETVEQFMAS